MLALYPHQRDGVEFLRGKHRAILGDEMGLGKTAQVLTALGPNRLPALVVCPASVRSVWADEVAKWRPGLRVDVIESGRDTPDRAADIRIVSYDLFGKVRLPKPAQIVCDEAHYLQGRESRRTLAIQAAAGRAEARLSLPLWMLTGTPLWSRPRSLFPLIYLCGRWKSGYRDFALRYCSAGFRPAPGRGGYRWYDDGASNLDELKERLRPVLLRRLKDEVLDLPAKTRQVVKVTSGLSEAEKELGPLDPAMVEDGWIPPGPIATAIRETALLKVPMAVRHIKDVLANEDKVVVFAWNLEVLDFLHHELSGYGVARIDGATAAPARREAVETFQEFSSPRIFLGQTAAAGTGLTLHAARVAIFIQPDWTPAVLLQAEDRIHRIGQTRPVLIQYLVTAGSIEEHMLKIVLDKTAVATHVLGDGTEKR